MVKTKGLLRSKLYFPQLDELVEKLIAKCVACKVVRKKTPIINFDYYTPTQKNHGYS